MGKNNSWRICLLLLIALGFMGCNNDNTVEPEGAIALNMLNEDNGKTTLGESGVYLDKSNNFTGRNVFLSDLGPMSNLGFVSDIKALPVADKVAATVGHGYLVYAEETRREFPSKNTAFAVGHTYYKMYIESAIEENKGVRVKYIPVTIPTGVLPEPETDITTGNASWSLDITKFRDVEYVVDPDLKHCFDFFVDEADGGSGIYLSIYQVEPLGYPATVNLYLRSGDKFSYVTFNAAY